MSRPSAWVWPLRLGSVIVTALSLACQPTPVAPAAAGAAATGARMVVGSLEEARARLSGERVSDFSLSLVGAPGQWRQGSRRVQAYGDPSAGAWTSGVPLTSLGCPAGDIATNGVAVRNFSHYYPNRAYVITRQGRFVDLDPAAPTPGAITTTLSGTFTKTYVSLSGDGTIAFVLNDAGTVFAIDLINVVAGAHPARSVATGFACVGTALFADPLLSKSNTAESVLFAVANDGRVVRVDFVPGASLAASTFTATSPGKATAITAPLTGTALVQSPPIALGGVLYVGDRRGNLNRYNALTNTLTSWAVNPGWPVETPPAVDVDDNLAVTDAFVAVGPQLHWVRPATGAVYAGQYALTENKGAGTYNGTITSATAGTFLTTASTTLRADSTYRAFSLYKHATNDAVTLPQATSFIDEDRVTHCEFMTGQPPSINQFSGSAGRTYATFNNWSGHAAPTGGNPAGTNPLPATGANIQPPLKDGEPFATARLLSPVAIDIDDDGSLFVGNANQCQVLFKPAAANSGQAWTSTGALAGSLNPNAYYVFAGTLDTDNTWNRQDIGNGAGGTVWQRPAFGASALTTLNARDTPINRVHGLAVGNLGLYIANRNAFDGDGEILFVPRRNLTGTYFGIVNPRENRMYVISNVGNPQGVIADRTTAGRDTVYYAGMNGGTNNNRIFQLTSTGTAITTLVTGLNDPHDVCLDDLGNLLIAETGGGNIKMRWKGGAGNDRFWGIASPVAGSVYTIASGLSSPDTVTFALNDPQVPSGCLYVGNTGDHTIRRIDDGGVVQMVAGTAGTAGDTGDGGAATGARLNKPQRARGDGDGTTYVCDRFNNRIRVLSSAAGSGQAQGYMRFNAATLVNRAIYSATLQLTSAANAGTLTAPIVGLASPYLKGTTTPWTHANVTPTLSPLIDTLGGLATPAAASWNFTNGSTHTWTLPAAAITTSNNAEGQAIRLGMTPPVDPKNYYYPTGIGLPTSATKSAEFDSHTDATAANRPTLNVVNGTVAIGRSVLSPPAINFGPGGQRYVYVANANALFRYNTTTTASFQGQVDVTLTAAGRTANGTIYAPDGTFQPNPTPPLVDHTGRVHLLDIKAASATSYSYTLNAFDGLAGSNNMWLNTTRSVATNVSSTYTDNAGIYMTSGAYVAVAEAYFGLGNGRLYRVTLQ